MWVVLLVTGPSGNVGAELTELLDRDRAPTPWRLASRHPEALRASLTDSATEPAEIVALDFFDTSTWARTLAGVETLFLLFPLPSNRVAHSAIIPFIDAAQQAGCRHVVYVSVFGADKMPFIPHHAVESALRRSAMTSTVLRCSFFMQNLHRSVSTHGVDIAERGELFIPAGRGATTFLDARDAAAVAFRALREPDLHRDAVYHLTGPQALTMSEVADELSAALGYPVHYTAPSLPRFVTRLRRRGVGWDSIGFMAAVYTLTRFGRNQPLTGDVSSLLGRPPTNLTEFLRDSAWRWHQRAWT